MSGYSKTFYTYKKLPTNIAQDLDQYKQFKKMYIVDETGEFEGKIKLRTIAVDSSPDIRKLGLGLITRSVRINLILNMRI